jgi:hypothetical protein
MTHCWSLLAAKKAKIDNRSLCDRDRLCGEKKAWRPENPVAAKCPQYAKAWRKEIFRPISSRVSLVLDTVNMTNERFV